MDGLISVLWCVIAFFFQAEDGIRALVRSRGLGDVYKRQLVCLAQLTEPGRPLCRKNSTCTWRRKYSDICHQPCLLYTSDAADDLLCVDLGGRRILNKKKNNTPCTPSFRLESTQHFVHTITTNNSSTTTYTFTPTMH